MRKIAVATVGRSDYGLLKPLLKRLQSSGSVELQIIAASASLVQSHGYSVREIEDDGFAPIHRVEMLLASDSSEAVALSMALGVAGFAKTYSDLRPDLLVLLGDRFDTLAAAIAAVPMNIPIAHLAGGEVTLGAVDDCIRHAITKLSHLHFVSTERYRQRVLQMGEEDARVFVSGSLSVDNAHSLPVLPFVEWADRFGLTIRKPFLLVTFHPVTLEHEYGEHQIKELLLALKSVDGDLLFTMPNADAGNRAIRKAIENFVAERRGAQAVESLGSLGYWSAMAHAAAMVGNSSSGIVEAASCRLPVVNVGSRQEGRLRPGNVIDVAPESAAISAGIDRALSSDFRVSLEGLQNPYGAGTAAELIATKLEAVELGPRLLRKYFRDFSQHD